MQHILKMILLEARRITRGTIESGAGCSGAGSLSAGACSQSEGRASYGHDDAAECGGGRDRADGAEPVYSAWGTDRRADCGICHADGGDRRLCGGATAAARCVRRSLLHGLGGPRPDHGGGGFAQEEAADAASYTQLARLAPGRNQAMALRRWGGMPSAGRRNWRLLIT